MAKTTVSTQYNLNHSKEITMTSMVLQDTTPINDLLQHAGSFQLQNNGVNFGHQYLITEFPFLATCQGFCPNTNNRDVYILYTTRRWSDQIVFFKTHSWPCPCSKLVDEEKRKIRISTDLSFLGIFQGCPHPVNPMTSLLHLLGWAMLIFCHSSSMGTAMGDALHLVALHFGLLHLHLPDAVPAISEGENWHEETWETRRYGKDFICRILCRFLSWTPKSLKKYRMARIN